MNNTKGVGARQDHGFDFEDIIIERYGYKKSDSYTGSFDAYNGNVPISIKTTQKGGEICMGDMFRQASIKHNYFVMFVGFWEGNKNNVTEVYGVRINTKHWLSMFNQDDVDYFRIVIEKAGKGHYGNDEDKAYWDKMTDVGKKSWSSKTDNVISPRFRWSKDNKHRIQCSVRYNNFMSNFVNVKGMSNNIPIENVYKFHSHLINKESISSAEPKEMSIYNNENHLADVIISIKRDLIDIINLRIGGVNESLYDELMENDIDTLNKLAFEDSLRPHIIQ